jgi:hypothetical protein
VSDNVISLERGYPAQDISATLRRIADSIDAGEYGVITTCVVCTGHTEEKPSDIPCERLMRNEVNTFAAGPRTDVFTVRGLLLSCAGNI